MRYYNVLIYPDDEPIVNGPFSIEWMRDCNAKQNWLENSRTKFDTLYRLDIDENGKAVMCQYDIDEEIEINDGE
jgi:hypothetical protein